MAHINGPGFTKDIDYLNRPDEIDEFDANSDNFFN